MFWTAVHHSSHYPSGDHQGSVCPSHSTSGAKHSSLLINVLSLQGSSPGEEEHILVVPCLEPLVSIHTIFSTLSYVAPKGPTGSSRSTYQKTISDSCTHPCTSINGAQENFQRPGLGLDGLSPNGSVVKDTSLLPKDIGSDPRTFKEVYNHQFQGSDPLFWPF